MLQRCITSTLFYSAADRRRYLHWEKGCQGVLGPGENMIFQDFDKKQKCWQTKLFVKNQNKEILVKIENFGKNRKFW